MKTMTQVQMTGTLVALLTMAAFAADQPSASVWRGKANEDVILRNYETAPNQSPDRPGRAAAHAIMRGETESKPNPLDR